ncbi:hypothetical protein [Paenibacillus tengchongensis]|uniref:hypothetical protein n=1 Tax=Paenibacillus tengchongensis TaxID=2608684 RepID=UPI00124E9184|nr:hypothetical protein [Paenibacillus tengchongensis]
MKLLKRALGVCLIVVLASALSVATTAIVVQTYIQSVLSGLGIDLGTPGPGIGGLVQAITGTGDNSGGQQEDTGSGTGAQESGAVSEGGQDTEEPAEEEVPENSIPVMGGVSSTETQGGGNVLDQQLVMTPEAMGEMKDSLPSSEKASIFNILMNKLPQEEMQKISTAMEDGLTESEVKELQDIIAKYVESEEYDQLMKMLTPNINESDGN